MEFCDSRPTNAAGKILKRKLHQRHVAPTLDKVKLRTRLIVSIPRGTNPDLSDLLCVRNGPRRGVDRHQCPSEAESMDTTSVAPTVTSVPFANQYEYTDP